MRRSIRAQARLTFLLTNHLLHTVRRQRARTLVLWAALALALGIGIGLLAFIASIEDSFRARGEAVAGLADLEVEGVGGSSLQPGLAARLDRLPGTHHAVPIAQQRVMLEADGKREIATAIGVDRSRYLDDVVLEDFEPSARGYAKGGITLPSGLAERLGVHPGDRLQLFAFAAAPELRVARIADVGVAISDVVTLPLKRLEALRGAPGRPTAIYVKLDAGTSEREWEHRAAPLLPENGVPTSTTAEQRQLNSVLDFTVRASTLVFGMVVLAIVGLLIYVLQLMRMLERQDDLGLLRALGSRRSPLIVAESFIVGGLLVAAIPVGLVIGALLSAYLAREVPGYLTDVFGFNMQVEIHPGVVVTAVSVTFLVGIAATVGALLSARGSVAEQLGRSPQAGAMTTSSISLRAALLLILSGLACLGLALLTADVGGYAAAAVTIIVGLALATPGAVGLVAIILGRREHSGSKIELIARGAVEANPRRAALAAAIMALGVAATVPPQLSEGALLDRIDLANRAIRSDAQNLLASDDSFSSVPIDASYARQALRGPNIIARPVAFSFVPYQDRKIEVRGLVPSTRGGLIGPGTGVPQSYPLLRRHPHGVMISRVMAAALGLGAGDEIVLPTASGPRRLSIFGEVEDFAWPSGTVYMTMRLYRHLFRTEAVSALAVDRRSKLDPSALRKLTPLHAISGTESHDRIEAQMKKSTQGLLAMRALTLLAALVAVVGITATSVFARRREWAVLRAMGISSMGLLASLALETLLVMSLGAVCGAIGGILSYRGPVLGFLQAQGYVLGGDVPLGDVLVDAVFAVSIGVLAAALPAWIIARTPLADALSYE